MAGEVLPRLDLRTRETLNELLDVVLAHLSRGRRGEGFPFRLVEQEVAKLISVAHHLHRCEFRR